jgi:hypothetical protein
MNLDPNAPSAAMGGMPDVSQIPLSPQDAKALLDAAEEAKRQQQQDMKSLMLRLQDKLDTVIKARRPIEQRWVDDLRQYDGSDRIRMSKQDATSSASGNSTPRIHATRRATDQFEARAADMLFPTSDYAFDLRPTPDDEWQGATQQHPEFGVQGVPQAPDATGVEEACRRMKRVIFDQLADCKFSSSGRKMVRDAARVGCGVLVGPVNTIKVQRRFNGPQMTMQVKEIPVPAANYVDFWNFFPDMVPSADKAEYAFCLNLMSRREVQDLKDFPSFDSEEIDELLESEPDLGELRENLSYRNTNMNRVEPTSDKYAVWRYTGTLTPKETDILTQQALSRRDSTSEDHDPDMADDMDAMNCACEDDSTVPMVDMWFSQTRVLKARIRPIDRDYRIPYYVFSPFPADDTMFGYGIPYMCRDSASVLDASWRITLWNASASCGAIIVTRAGKVEPRDRSWEMRGPKVMEVTDPDVELTGPGGAIDSILIPANIQDNLAMVDRAEAILRDESMMDDVGQPGGTEASPTASGLAMQMNAATILLKRAAACADDDLFTPLIQRMYWWNMLFNDRADIKGDFDVIPLGQSKQMVKDIQVQHLMAFMQMTAGNPKLAPYVNDYAAMKYWMGLAELPVDQLLNDKDKTDAAMQNQPNPALDLANAKVAEASAKAKKLNVDADIAQAKTQSELQNGTVSPQDASLQMQDLQVRREEAQKSVQVASIKAAADMQKASSHAQSSGGSDAANQNIAALKSRSDLQKAGLKARMDAAKLAQGQQGTP